jgi:broad specificity phosphatase PhoE
MANPKQKVFILRHGETNWTLSGQHTGTTDLVLTEKGRQEAALIKKVIEKETFAKVFSSPMQRSLETAKIAGLSNIEIDRNLMEWNYGIYEGVTTKDIQKEVPNWHLFDHGCPKGEKVEEVGKRADQIIEKILETDGDVAVISHGHFSRVFAARWLRQPALFGKFLYLNTASISILAFEHNNINEPIIKTWNSTTHLRPLI